MGRARRRPPSRAGGRGAGRQRVPEAVGGGAIAALGILLATLAIMLGADALYAPGLTLIAVVALAWAWLELAGRGARVRWALERRRVVEGEPFEAEIEILPGRVPLPGGRLLAPPLPEPIAIGAARSPQIVVLELRLERRGRRRLPAPELRLHGALGLISGRVARMASSRSPEVVVLPRVSEVRPPAGGARSATATGLRGAAPEAPLEVDGVRPYRAGTPAARIHWPALARGAGLFERHTVEHSGDRPLIVLDPRTPASDDALDSAIRAAASLALELARAGGCSLLIAGEHRPHTLEPDLRAWPELHLRLALVDEHGPAALVPRALARGDGGLLYVTSRSPASVPATLRRAGRVVLVAPGPVDGRAPSFSVAGCHGYVDGVASRAVSA